MEYWRIKIIEFGDVIFKANEFYHQKKVQMNIWESEGSNEHNEETVQGEDNQNNQEQWRDEYCHIHTDMLGVSKKVSKSQKRLTYMAFEEISYLEIVPKKTEYPYRNDEKLWIKAMNTEYWWIY